MSDDNSHEAVLLEGVTSYEARMVRTLLKDVGIPCRFDGPDFDVAELGRAAHDNFRGVHVLVPTVALAEAKARLDEAWADGADGERGQSEETGTSE